MVTRFGPAHLLVALAAVLATAVSLMQLQRQRADIAIERTWIGSTPVTLWRPAADGARPLVVVAHGYAGSRQMMQPLAITLARSGFNVAAFDFYGHGRNREPMDADVTSLDGATAQLVDETRTVTRAMRALPGVSGPVALVGHSMATDIVIRAAEEIEDVAAVVAISMYSDAVSASFPERLLIVSGAREARLRDVALDRLRQLDPAAEEGETVLAGRAARRAIAAPRVGHVGVLYSETTLVETRDWIAAAMERPAAGAPASIGPWLALLLISLVAVVWPLSAVLGPPEPAIRRGRRTALLALAVPVVPALAAAVLVPAGLLGLTGFGALAAFFAVWGAVQMAVLWRAGVRPSRPDAAGASLLLIWGLGVFALALDRYGAAFLPTGPRAPLMALLLVGTMPFCLSDTLLTRSCGVWLRLAARVLPLAALLAAMLVVPRLGTAFTVLPVMVLFWLVYGTAGRWVASRTGPTTSGIALGVILAWALAASTPLVAS